jgi:excisionase family DNA binding protein
MTDVALLNFRSAPCALNRKCASVSRAITRDELSSIMTARERLERARSRIEPRGLSRDEAAVYIGVSPTKFDEMVADGRMPQPKPIDGRVVWDRFKLDASFDALPNREERNPWDDLLRRS